MKTKRLFIYLPLLLVLVFGVEGCSSDDSLETNDISIPNGSNLFIGKWKILRIEDMGTVSDYTGDNSTVTFYEDRRFAYTPYPAKGIEGEVFGIYESSESLIRCDYEYTENELCIHHFSSGIKNIYTYVFSDNNETLRIVLTKREEEGDVCYLLPPPSGALFGKTLVLRKLL